MEKLADIGIDRGVLYSCAGFTRRARARAADTRSPDIMVLTIESPRCFALVRRADEPAEPDDGLPPYEAARVDEVAFAFFLWPACVRAVDWRI